VKPLRYVTIMLTLLIVSMSIACSQSSLLEYQARNRAEAEIKAVLLEYLGARQRFDIEILHIFLRLRISIRLDLKPDGKP